MPVHTQINLTRTFDMSIDLILRELLTRYDVRLGTRNVRLQLILPRTGRYDHPLGLGTSNGPEGQWTVAQRTSSCTEHPSDQNFRTIHFYQTLADRSPQTVVNRSLTTVKPFKTGFINY